MFRSIWLARQISHWHGQRRLLFCKNQEWVRSVLIKIKLQHNSSINFSVLLLMHLIVPIQNISYTVHLHDNTLFEEKTNGMVRQYQTNTGLRWKKEIGAYCITCRNTYNCMPPPTKKIKLNRNMASILWMGHHTKVASTGLAFVRFSKYKGFVLQCHSLILWLNNIVIHICSF